ncbi:MAG: alpha/beta hydrolase [Microbacteriaceae bacterium]
MPWPSSRSVRRTAGGLAVIGVAAALAWAASPFLAENAPLADARALPGVALTETADAVVLTPDDPTGSGLVFVAGARVEAAAYAHKLSGLAEQGITVVIARPILNFAIAEFRPLEHFTALGAGVDSWFVGGHSLGGVRACQYAADAAGSPGPAVEGLILAGSYCAVDLAEDDLAVLSLGGGRDGLSTPEKIADSAHLLPEDTRFAQLDGASHAQFGDYGVQPGDGTPTASDAEVRDWISDEVVQFIG